MSTYYKRTFGILFLITTILAACFLAAPRVSRALGACASVRIQILQELTLERIAFDAKMAITNNVPDKDLTNIRVDITIKDEDGNVKNDLFFTRLSSNSNINAVDGTGFVAAATMGEAHWLIIPAASAGGSDPAGKAYYVGATLTYSVDGNQEVVSVNPARIIVKPEPQLVLDYFTPHEVLGDNPFTSKVEAPVPYLLAVRVLNEGYGPATNLKIDSAQPEIIDNDQGLLIGFMLLGSAVNDSAVSPSLTVPIGTVESKKISTAYWEMISTLSGRITSFEATFSHASELGGELTSLLKETNTHYLTHRVKVNLPGRDSKLDFLADSDKDVNHLPDTIFESEIPNNTGNPADSQSPVTVVSVIAAPARPTASAFEVSMSLETGTAGWIYASTPDPSQGLLELTDVVRGDGVHLDPNNFWIQEGLDGNYQQIFTLNVLDYRADAAAAGTYTLVFTQPAEDNIPPSTTLNFDGPVVGSADSVYYITPSTRIILTATDNEGGSGVDQMFRKVIGTDADFVSAYPFQIETAGTYTLEYYSSDRAEPANVEAVKTATIVVDDAAPAVQIFQASPSTISPYAPAGLVAARTTNISLKATDDKPTLQATIDIVNAQAAVVRTLETSLTKDVETSVSWDGRDSLGALVSTGTYTVLLNMTDGLESSGTSTSHTTTQTTTVTVEDWFKGQALDPNLSGSQQHPEISGTRAVWQDNRSGMWQIHMKDTQASQGSASQAITSNASNHQYPAISGDIIVWQDDRNGNSDIYGYNLSSQQEFVICDDAGNQERPVIAGDWVAWQDDRNGNWDIYAYSLAGQTQIQVTSHLRDQMHPAISGTTLAWEDYRHGLGEIYTYDPASQIETRHTVDLYNQTLPAVYSAGSGTLLVWTDQKNGQRDIYFSPSLNNDVRVTYGSGDHSQATILDGVIVYTDYEAGEDDPNLSFYDTASGLGSILTANPSRQEESALGNDVLVWQDNRDGVSQIYWSPFAVEPGPIAADIEPGLNLVAVGEKLAALYPTTSSLISASTNSISIQKIVGYNSKSGTYMDTSAGAEISLKKGIAIGIYASERGSLELADMGESTEYTLLPGRNYIGLLSVPNGYTAYSLLESIGLDNVQSVRRFNNQTGSWESASVRDVSGEKSSTGVNFAIHQGEGLIINMKNGVTVYGWKP